MRGRSRVKGRGRVRGVETNKRMMELATGKEE